MSVPEASFDAFITRYVELWNEPGDARRRELIEELWSPDCANYTRTLEVHGRDALEERVRASYQKWVRDAGCRFRPRHADQHHGAVRFAWEMVDASDQRVRSLGVELLLLDATGRIRADYQFMEPA